MLIISFLLTFLLNKEISIVILPLGNFHISGEKCGVDVLKFNLFTHLGPSLWAYKIEKKKHKATPALYVSYETINYLKALPKLTCILDEKKNILTKIEDHEH